MDDKHFTIKDLTERMHELVKSKGWYEQDSKRPQTPRNLAISLSLEAAEILEHFQFREKPKDKEEFSSEHRRCNIISFAARFSFRPRSGRSSIEEN